MNSFIILDLEGTVDGQETRLRAAEENIQGAECLCQNYFIWDLKKGVITAISLFLGLQMTDVELDARVTALEENGGGNTDNGNNRILIFFRTGSFCSGEKIIVPFNFRNDRFYCNINVLLEHPG